MRSLLLAFATAAMLFGAFVVYTRLAAPPARPEDEQAVATQPSPSVEGNTNGPMVSGAWVNLYDKSGRFYGRLRSRECTPLADGIYHLIEPEAEFYQSDGEMSWLTAVDGNVRFGEHSRRSAMNGGAFDPPSQGVLHTVIIRLFPTTAARQANLPDMTVWLPNAQFDADTYRIVTIDETNAKTGQMVSADEQPVMVRGNDLDFDGRGLVIIWNDQVHDLKSALVAHGERLQLKNVTDMQATPPKQAARGPARVPGAQAQAANLASDVAAPPVDAASAPAGGSTHVYLATLIGNVRVMQAGQNRVLADQLEATMMRHETSSATINSPPIPPPDNSLPDKPRSPKDMVAPTPLLPPPAHPAPPANANNRAGAAVPTTQPVDIFWTGSLKVVPSTSGSGARLRPDEAIVRFTGSPVHVIQDNVDLSGALARYVSGTGTARMTATDAIPLLIVMKQPDGSLGVVHGGSRVEFDQNAQTAIFSGAGSASYSDPKKKDEALSAAWANQCNLYFGGGGKNEPTYIRSTQMIGNAWISDRTAAGVEKLHLAGSEIDTDFNTPAPRPPGAAGNKKPAGSQMDASIRQVVAQGPAQCIVRDDKSVKTIDSDKLTIRTAADTAGHAYPQTIIADGNVRAAEPDDLLLAHRMEATLSPIAGKPTANSSDTPKFELQQMLATGDVRVKGKDNQSAAGDDLLVEQQQGQTYIKLWGSPPALVSGQSGTLRGPVIEMRPHDQWAKITGTGQPGSCLLDAIRAGAPGEPGQPMHVRWSNYAELRGAENIVDVRGDVSADTIESTGERNQATSDRASLELMAAPTTRPASAKASSSDSLTGGADLDLFKGKQIKTVSLLDNAKMTSTLSAADGSIIRREFLTGDRIDTYLIDQRLQVPGKGAMLLEEHPKPGQKLAARAAATTSPSTGSNGSTGFYWTKSFIFDQRARNAVIEGSVEVVHLPDSPKPDATTVWADRVTAEFEPPAMTKAAASPTSPTPALDENAQKLKHLTATGNVQIQTGGTTINASDVEFDPATELLTANGSPTRPVTFSSRGNGTFQQAIIDVKENKIIKLTDFSGVVR